ncbi:hypothetical protein NBH00_14040 [Paraconexibacter antarcticus]|uniref:DUF2029 domain-containing protein n=1 Tax=Paraconexibacter antarcticus TaxID=2949664 RepID=A0ABY5DL26_9ACTN|nr:hypothetical protein [Paraconexibacter antarcticus]UTI62483.1 hypothetical protein NBH00_14040 [Paraconexibacter antarcticus]
MKPRDVALLVLAAALAAVALRDGVAPHDEGLMLAWGQRIADGQLPYRDFWCNYGPAQPYVLGGLTAVLGPSLLAWRIVRVLVGAVAAWLAYRLVRDEAEGAPHAEAWALGAWAASAGALAWPLLPSPTVPALALGLAALWAARTHPALAGALAGAAGLFRPELGVAFAVAVFWRAGRSLGAARRAPIGAAAVFGLGWLPFVVAAPGDVAGQVVGFLGKQSDQRLPFPPPYHDGLDPNKLLEGHIAVILVAAAVLWAALRRGPAWLLVPLLASVGYLLARADEFHLVPLGVLVAVGLGVAGARAPGRAGSLVAAALLALIALHGLDRQAGRWRHPGPLAAVPGPAGDGVRTTPADAAALRRLRAALATPGPLLVLPPRTDRVRVGDPLLNVITGRRNPTRYDVMQPGVVTTAKVQREMIGDLRAAPGTRVVRWTAPAARLREPNASGREHGARLLDRWIARRYRPVLRAGPYVLLVRR